MPLTEHEKRVLAEIEQDLSSSDSTWASGLRDVPHPQRVRRLWSSGGLFFAGIVLLLAGVITTQVPIGVIGFVLMLTAAMRAAPVVRAWVSAREPPRQVGRRFADQFAAARRRQGRRGDG